MKVVAIIAILPAIATCVCLLGHRPESNVYPASNRQVSLAAHASDDAAPTWSRDVAPILYRNCTTCHHPGGGGPFSLLTYVDARRWGPQILTVTQSRFMPPWLPEPGYGDFADVRSLADQDRALLKRWVSGKMLQGEPSAAPPPPHYNEEWLMGKPDLVLKVTRPFSLNAGGTDVFRNFILPLSAETNRICSSDGDFAGHAQDSAPRQHGD